MVLRLHLLLHFLAFFFLLSSIDVASRGLESITDDLLLQESADLGGSITKWRREEEEERERVSVRRKVTEEDYPGTGANNHHDPWTPGRS